jgi:branched-chain amino acid transport system ATP-binding protein
MLIVQNIKCSYGHIQALSGIDFKVNQGDIVTLIGNNGAGKSTTLNAICGIAPKVSGEIVFRGRRIEKLSSDRIISLGICQVPEGRRIFPLLTVEENLLMGAYLRKYDKKVEKDKEMIYKIFPALKNMKKKFGGELSGGEQQMLAIGRGLMADPDLLLLDEPSLGLAPFLVKEIFRIIKEINSSGTTILLVEQNARLALQIATKGYVMEKGRIVLQGSGKELLTNKEVRKIYLGEN